MEIVISKLENWYFQKDKDRYRIFGNVFQHPHFTDGQWIRSSVIQEVAVKENALQIRTAHSCYEAEFVSCQERDLRTLRMALRETIWPQDEEIYQKIQNTVKQQGPVLLAEDCSTCTIFVFGQRLKEVLLKHNRKEIAVTGYDVHSGMFQDIVEVSDPRLDYCYRFFSFEKNCYEFEEWDTKYAPVFLRNTGEETVYASTVYGDFAILPGRTCALDPLNTKDRTVIHAVHMNAGKTTVLSHESLIPKKQ